jgi:S1-C subfamily serine protease
MTVARLTSGLISLAFSLKTLSTEYLMNPFALMTCAFKTASHRNTILTAAAALVLLAGSLLTSPAIASTTTALAPMSAKQMVEKHGGALVHVKFVLKIEGMGQDREMPEEIGGIMIEDSGLVLVSNFQTGGMAGMMGASGMSASPREIKVLIGDDQEGVEATLIARDSEADLAWVKITDPKGKKFDAIDFSKGATPDLGDEVIFIGRKGKYFDRVPFVQMHRIEAVTKKPRHLFLVETQAYGSPAFAADGSPVGVVIFQTPNREESEGASMDMSDRGGLAILPAADIMTATVRAKEAAASGKPVDPPAPKSDEKPADAPAAPANPK